MSELHHRPERATHHRSLDMLMEVQFVLDHVERAIRRRRVLGQEPDVNTQDTKQELEALRQGIGSLPAHQALERAEAIRGRAQQLFVAIA